MHVHFVFTNLLFMGGGDRCSIRCCNNDRGYANELVIRSRVKGILKLILVIFCISWKLAIGSINDIYETLTRFLSMKLCKSDVIRW
jgi:hypothetical protein